MTSRLTATCSVAVLGAALGLLALGLAACSTDQQQEMGEGASKVRAGFGDAVSAPLEDLNIKRHEIPPVLLRSEANAYDLTRMKSCEAVAAEVGALDDALGPDLDEPPPPLTPQQQQGDKAAATTLDVVRGASHSVVPFRSWVRMLTGAEKHSKAVQSAIKAGSERRAYLKGIGMRMDCAPPAAPSWYRPTRLQDAATPAPKPRRKHSS
ncbi:MAG TPA: hypothetical protein VGL66_13115 [Caulobacteraceae bacterium]